MTEPTAGRSHQRLVCAVAGAGLVALSAGSLAQEVAPASPAERARAAFGGGAPEPTAQQEEDAAAAVARSAVEGLGVELLGARTIELENRSLVAARVMEPGGNSNAAFLVQTLIVDPASGQVLGVFPGAEADLGRLPPPGATLPATSGGASPPDGAVPD